MEDVRTIKEFIIMENTTILNNSSVPDNGSSQPITCEGDDVTFNFYINVLVIGTLCICGIVGNTLSILVLRKDPKTTGETVPMYIWLS